MGWKNQVVIGIKLGYFGKKINLWITVMFA